MTGHPQGSPQPSFEDAGLDGSAAEQDEQARRAAFRWQGRFEESPAASFRAAARDGASLSP
jgi:hypothetical protein